MPASRATSRKLKLPKPRSALSCARAASIKARRVFSFCSALVANVLLHGPLKPCILAPGFLIVIPAFNILSQFSSGTPDFQCHCVYNGRLLPAPPQHRAAKNDVASGGGCAFRNLAEPWMAEQSVHGRIHSVFRKAHPPPDAANQEHIQIQREPICAVIIAVGSTNPTSIRKSLSADGYTAAVTTAGLSSWICEIGMACLRWLSILTPLRALPWRKRFAASLLLKSPAACVAVRRAPRTATCRPARWSCWVRKSLS